MSTLTSLTPSESERVPGTLRDTPMLVRKSASLLSSEFKAIIAQTEIEGDVRWDKSQDTLTRHQVYVRPIPRRRGEVRCEQTFQGRGQSTRTQQEGRRQEILASGNIRGCDHIETPKRTLTARNRAINAVEVNERILKTPVSAIFYVFVSVGQVVNHIVCSVHVRFDRQREWMRRERETGK